MLRRLSIEFWGLRMVLLLRVLILMEGMEMDICRDLCRLEIELLVFCVFIIIKLG